MKSLDCNHVCANLKRFGGFYNLIDEKKVYYPASLVKFAHYNNVALKKLEQKLDEFLISS